MENFKVKIKNFGKIAADAATAATTVSIGKFTVFAGRNNTGKSFVSKALYSIFGGMNTNHLEVVFDPLLAMLREHLRWINTDGDIQSEHLPQFADAIEKLRALVGKISSDGDIDEFSAVEKAAPQLSQLLDEIGIAFARLKPELEKTLKLRPDEEGEEEDIMFFGDNDLESMISQVNALLRMKESKPVEYIMDGLQRQIWKNFLGNFQVSDMSRLYGGEGEFAHFDIEGIGSLALKDERHTPIDLEIKTKGLHTMQKYSDVLYLESPVFWRLKDALEEPSGRGVFHPRYRRQAPDVPKYFYDMATAIRGDYAGDIDFSDVLEEIHAEIGGRVIIEPNTGNLIFQEEGKGNFPLPRTAMGVTNFGMLGLLMERNVLDKSTFLFIDEPEAHLHPAWQVAMTKVLIRLAERGVKVVMATHSADILKWLEIYVKENPDSESLFALNRFADGTVKSGGDFGNDLTSILDDLTEPYQDMFIRGLRP